MAFAPTIFTPQTDKPEGSAGSDFGLSTNVAR